MKPLKYKGSWVWGMQKSPFFALESGFRPFLFAVEFEYLDEEEKKSQGGFQYTLFFLIFIKTKALITKRGAFQ